MLYRLPTNETLRPYVKNILLLMLKLLEIDNEENVLVCLKIIIELHKQYRPPFSPEVIVRKFFINIFHLLKSRVYISDGGKRKLDRQGELLAYTSKSGHLLLGCNLSFYIQPEYFCFLYYRVFLL